MHDYARLCKALRHCATHFSCSGCGGDCKTGSNEPRTKAVLNDAADAIEELLAAVPKWVSVEERLPEPRTVVLLFSHEGTFVGYMHDDKRFTVYASSYPERPTHWMPLPKAPKEVE